MNSILKIAALALASLSAAHATTINDFVGNWAYRAPESNGLITAHRACITSNTLKVWVASNLTARETSFEWTIARCGERVQA